MMELYRREVALLEAHCRTRGFVDGLSGEAGLLEVRAVPDYLAAVRASDSYNARPGSPPRGGTFFVYGRGREGGLSLEYRMTTAHETWPGHPLLDLSRWSLSRPLRRPIEGPLFYEGWACLAEEIMAGNPPPGKLRTLATGIMARDLVIEKLLGIVDVEEEPRSTCEGCGCDTSRYIQNHSADCEYFPL